MTRRLADWNWENPEAQAAFAEWVGFPDAAATARGAELAASGYGVVGIDIAETCIEQARRAVVEAGVAATDERFGTYLCTT